MNHDQNHYGLARAADRALTRILLIGLFGLACFTGGWFAGEGRAQKECAAMQPAPTKGAIR